VRSVLSERPRTRHTIPWDRVDLVRRDPVWMTEHPAPLQHHLTLARSIREELNLAGRPGELAVGEEEVREAELLVELDLRRAARGELVHEVDGGSRQEHINDPCGR
jgi:hypothetical protein